MIKIKQVWLLNYDKKNMISKHEIFLLQITNIKVLQIMFTLIEKKKKLFFNYLIITR